MGDRFPSLQNIEFLIDGNGEITIGEAGPVAGAATACTENQALAMLVRHDNETLNQLLMRLESVLDKAYEEEIFIDEINHGLDDRI